MRKNAIFLSRNDVIYKGITYDIDYFLKNVVNKKKRNVFIIGEDMYIKVHNVESKEDLKVDNINLLIKKYFGDSDNYLIHYEISKDKNNIYIYAIRGGVYVERLCEAPIVVNIVPIQISIVKLCNKIIKEKDYMCTFVYRNLYYYISVKGGYIIESLIKSNLEEIKDILSNIDGAIYVDDDIKGEIEGNKINLKERSIYNENVC